MKKFLIFLITTISFSTSVLTSTQVNYTLSNYLLEDTGIKVVSVFETFESMESDQDKAFKRLDEMPKDFNAVVDLRYIWANDYLYEYARRDNIYTVEIDASYSFEGNESLSLNLLKNNLFVWLDIDNTKKMSEIIARDFIRLFPDKKTIIQANLDKLIDKLDFLDLEYRTINLDGVIILSDSLEYLVAYMNLPYSKDIDEELFDIVLGDKILDKESLKKLESSGKKYIYIETGEYPVESADDEDLMDVNGLFEIYENNLNKLRGVE